MREEGVKDERDVFLVTNRTLEPLKGGKGIFEDTMQNMNRDHFL